MTLTKYKLGVLIEPCDERNNDGLYTLDDVKGISTGKEFIDTKANMDGVCLSSYKVVKSQEFAYVADTSRRGEKIAIAFNNVEKAILISSIYTVFRVARADLLNSDYLFMYFNRPEFDRYARFNSWGSARETFDWDTMCDIDIELPDLPTQQKYVDIYKAMVANQQSYERGLEDLKLVCDGFIEELKKNSLKVTIGDIAYLSDERNKDEGCKNVKGLTVYKKFIDTKANMDGVSLHNYKLVQQDDIAYVPTTNRNGDKIACGIADEPCIISSIYEVLKVNKTKCSPKYLFLWFLRTEMDRYARYNSWGSAREVIEWKDLSSYKIPLPPIEIQESIANIYDGYIKRKNINERLKLQIKDICPVLIQGAMKEGKV